MSADVVVPITMALAALGSLSVLRQARRHPGSVSSLRLQIHRRAAVLIVLLTAYFVVMSVLAATSGDFDPPR